MENYNLMNDKISIIMPAYNAEKTIENSIKSILNQSYRNIELIVVNDGSIDTTEVIVRRLMKYDNRIRIITIPNGGVSHARNVGIDNALGDYIGFVDSDDTIDSDMYEILMSLINKYDVKIAHCSYKNVSYTGEVLSVVGTSDKEYLLNHDEALRTYLSGKLFAGGLWNKLYHNSLFCNLRLEEDISFNEDVLINFFLFDSVDASVYINKPCYNYVANMNSATHKADVIKFSEDCNIVNKTMLESSKNKPYENIAKKRYANSLLNSYRTYIFSDMISSKKAKDVFQKIMWYYHNGLYSSRKEKLSVQLYKYAPKFYKIIYRVYDKVRKKELDPEQ